MRWTSALAIYFIIWFFCLFLVLPFHARSHSADDAAVAGQDGGAPHRFAPGRAALQVTVLALVIFGIYYANYVMGWLTADSIGTWMSPPS